MPPYLKNGHPVNVPSKPPAPVQSRICRCSSYGCSEKVAFLPEGSVVSGAFVGVKEFRLHQAEDRRLKLLRMSAIYVPPSTKSTASEECSQVHGTAAALVSSVESTTPSPTEPKAPQSSTSTLTAAVGNIGADAEPHGSPAPKPEQEEILSTKDAATSEEPASHAPLGSARSNYQRNRKLSKEATKAASRLHLLTSIHKDFVQRRDNLVPSVDLVFSSTPGNDPVLPPVPSPHADDVDSGPLALNISAPRNHSFLSHELWVLDTLDAVDGVLTGHVKSVEAEKNCLLRDLEDELVRLHNCKLAAWKDQELRNARVISQGLSRNVIAASGYFS